MARTLDPLACIPSPEAVRRKLEETLILAERLRVLLDVAERIGVAKLPRQVASVCPAAGSQQ